jgi:predicted Zn-dependent protease
MNSPHSFKERGVKKRIASIILIYISLFYLTGCAIHPVTLEKELMIVSEEKEIAIGEKSDPYILQQYGYYDDPVLQDYINRVGQKLVKVCRRRDVAYRFKVLDTDEINAFALPGGYIYITRGILAIMNSEAELAGVLGHEIGHVVGRDSANRISQQSLYQIVALAAMAAPGTRDLAMAGNLLFESVMLGYGREKEYLADTQGVEYMYKAGYDPMQMCEFQRNMSMFAQGPAGYAQYLTTHPDIFDRIHRTRAQAKVAYAMRSAFSKQNDNGEGQTPEPMGLILSDEYKERLDGLAYGSKENIRRIKIYTVKEGDNLESIASKEMGDKRKVKEISFLNGLDVGDQLHAGQKLKVVVY